MPASTYVTVCLAMGTVCQKVAGYEYPFRGRAPRRASACNDGTAGASLRFAPRKNDLSGADLTLAAAAGAIRTSVTIASITSRSVRQWRHRAAAGRLRGRFSTSADRDAHSRCAPAMPSLPSCTHRISGRPWTRATCERRDRDPVNRPAGVRASSPPLSPPSFGLAGYRHDFSQVHGSREATARS